ncbi:hypothetical protein DFH09DRAFT_1048484 [Mycena vulgaris]|nr:hypothetical protein DFH09DRAFT_1048484 [Mycena vulgaris]
MKYILSAIIISLAVGLPSTLSVQAAHTQIRSSETCGDPANAAPFYRSYNPTAVDHFYSATLGAVTDAIKNAGYVLEDLAGFVFTTQELSTVPFYHLYNPAATDNFYTTSAMALANAVQNGYSIVANNPFTFIYPTQVCGSIPFFHLYHGTKQDNFYTTSDAERQSFIANGYTDIDIAGYVLPVSPAQCD